jgi:hypothetical protein
MSKKTARYPYSRIHLVTVSLKMASRASSERSARVVRA